MDMILAGSLQQAAPLAPPAGNGANLLDFLYRADTSDMRRWVDRNCQRFVASTDAVDDQPMDHIQSKFSSAETPLDGMPALNYLDMLEADVLPHCSHLASPRYLGHMTSPIPNFLPEIGRLVQTLNQNVVKMETSRGLTYLERQVLGMLHREIYGETEGFYTHHLQDVASTLGIVTSGGTIANLCALWTAVRRAGLDAEPAARRPAVVIGSELMHYSFDKSAQMLGLRLVKVPVDSANRMDMAALRQAVADCDAQGDQIVALVAIAGTTDYGSVDPLAEICTLARSRGIHAHVDAAWGGGLLLSQRCRHVLDGIHLADTVTVDGHKQLFTPIGCGMLFFREPGLSEAIKHHAPYAVRSTSQDQGRFTLEGTRPATALYLHAALHMIGKSGYDQLFFDSLARARNMARQIHEHEAFELVTEPVMNILTYRYMPEAFRGRPLDAAANDAISRFNQRLQKAQRKKGDSFVSRTQRAVLSHQGRSLTLLRAVLLNPLTTDDDIAFLLRDQVAIARRLESPDGSAS